MTGKPSKTVQVRHKINLVCLDTSCSYEGEERTALQSCSSSFTHVTTGRIETYQIVTYSIRKLLKMDYWSPKHVELLNIINKINHQILCILLDYIYIPCQLTLLKLRSLFRFNAVWLIYVFFFRPAYKCHDDTPNQGTKITDKTMHNRSINFNGCNMHDILVIKWLCSKVCESESDNPWRNISDSDDMENLLYVTSLISTNWAETENRNDDE